MQFIGYFLLVLLFFVVTVFSPFGSRDNLNIFLGGFISGRGSFFPWRFFSTYMHSLLPLDTFMIKFLSTLNKLNILNQIFYHIFHMKTLIGVVAMNLIETTTFGPICIGRFYYQIGILDPNFLKIGVRTLLWNYVLASVIK